MHRPVSPGYAVTVATNEVVPGAVHGSLTAGAAGGSTFSWDEWNPQRPAQEAFEVTGGDEGLQAGGWNDGHPGHGVRLGLAFKADGIFAAAAIREPL